MKAFREAEDPGSSPFAAAVQAWFSVGVCFCLEQDEDAVFHVLPSLGQAPVAWKMMGKVQGLIALFIKPQNKYRSKYCNMLLSMLKNDFKKKIQSKTREEQKVWWFIVGLCS